MKRTKSQKKNPPRGGKWPSRRDEKPGETVRAMPMACADETAAVEMWERLRWGDRPTCPRCGTENVRNFGHVIVLRSGLRPLHGHSESSAGRDAPPSFDIFCLQLSVSETPGREPDAHAVRQIPTSEFFALPFA